jgi:uncharacterized protein YdaU (DUF1376 family)
MSKSDAWMPLYIGDYLSDTTHLTCEQSGAYLHLLMHCWRVGAPPDNDVTLAQITRLPLRAWKAHRETIAAFFSVSAGAWHHKRVEAERKKTAEVKERYSERGQKAAAKRWSKDATSNASSMQEACNGHGNSQSHTSIEVISPVGDSSAEPTEEPLTVEEVVGAWNETAQRLGLAVVKKLTRERQQKTLARIRENSIDDFKAALTTIEQSPFLRGEGRGGWKADFDFFVQKSSFIKLVEGSYAH